MHEPVKEGLEEYLRTRQASPALNEHLAQCEECREEVSGMEQQALWLRTLKAPDTLEPRAGFYARVMERIEAQGRPATFWGAFLQPVFAKRLAFATMTLVVLTGTYLATTNADEAEEQLVADHAETLLAPPPPVTDVNLDDNLESSRDATLVNLTTYAAPASPLY